MTDHYSKREEFYDSIYEGVSALEINLVRTQKTSPGDEVDQAFSRLCEALGSDSISDPEFSDLVIAQNVRAAVRDVAQQMTRHGLGDRTAFFTQVESRLNRIITDIEGPSPGSSSALPPLSLLIALFFLPF